MRTAEAVDLWQRDQRDEDEVIANARVVVRHHESDEHEALTDEFETFTSETLRKVGHIGAKSRWMATKA